MGKKSISTVVMHFLEEIIDKVSVVMFIVIFIVAMTQIFMRWVLHNPLVWSEELIRLMFVWICYLGWTTASLHNTHIEITAVESKLPEFGQKLLRTFNCFMTILFSVLMVVFGIKMSAAAVISHAVSLPFINFAMVYAICPFSNAVIILYQITKITMIWNDSCKEIVQ